MFRRRKPPSVSPWVLNATFLSPLVTSGMMDNSMNHQDKEDTGGHN